MFNGWRGYNSKKKKMPLMGRDVENNLDKIKTFVFLLVNAKVVISQALLSNINQIPDQSKCKLATIDWVQRF